MFKSTEEFDTAVYNTLQKLINGENIHVYPEQYDKLDYSDILSYIIDNRLIKGANNTKLSEPVMLIGNPRISRNGLSFIESFTEV